MATARDGAALRKVGGVERPSAARSAVGDSIASHLRQLQAQRREELEVEPVLSCLVSAAATLLERGMLVSLAITPDGRAVRMSVLIAKEWVPWYASNAEEADELAGAIVMALKD